MFRIAPIIVCVIFCASLFGQEAEFHTLRVDKKKGEPTGVALITINGKPKRISTGAFQAWPIMDEQNALVIVREPKNASGEYRLRYVEGESKKRRDLGPVPFTAAELTQHKQADGSWIFVLSGKAEGRSAIVVTDETAIRGRLQNDSDPKLTADDLTYKDDATGESKTVKLATLMGADMTAIYRCQDKIAEYAEFLWDASAAAAHPQWYNALTNNCVSPVIAYLARNKVGGVSVWDWRAVLNGPVTGCCMT